ncbi:unnamed protein product, partial [Darwinula stevensoni]
EHREKIITSWNDDNGTITYLNNRTWYFLPKESTGNLEDNITNLNPVALTAAHVAKKNNSFSEFMLYMLDGAFEELGVTLFDPKPVRELLFEGYNDKIIDVVKNWTFLHDIFTIPFDKFGWFYPRNGSIWYDGVINMNTGAKDLSTFGEIQRWNFSPKTDYYQGECGVVNGSAGELFPPNREKDSITIFVPDFCRQLVYKDNAEKYGLKGYRFWADANFLANAIKNPSNWCYSRDNITWPSGVLEVSKCKFGAPAFVSHAHFHMADSVYRENVLNLKEPSDSDNFYLTLEPITGVPLEVLGNLQLNMHLENIPEIKIMKDVRNVMMPMMWFSQTAEITPELANSLFWVAIAKEYLPPIMYCLLGLGVFFVIFAVILLMIQSRDRSSEEQLLTTDEDDETVHH